MGNLKDTFFFTHDFGARNDPKLLSLMKAHSVAGIGLFWCIIEQIYEQGGKLPLSSCKSIAYALHVECKIIEDVVMNHGLFKNDGEMFWSESVNDRLNRRKDIADKRKAAAEKRWQSAPKKETECKCNANVQDVDANANAQDVDANAMQMQCKCNANAQDIDANANAQDIDANAMLCNAIKEKERKGNTKIEGKKDEDAKRFTPPLLDEVKIYISEKKYSVDAESFIAFYQSKNWFVGKNKMKDWRAAVVTWEKRNDEKRGSTFNVNDIWK